jgi:OOP family OmpA-OmpF porin
MDKRIGITAAAMLALFAGQVAGAAESGFYVGAGIGKSEIEVDDAGGFDGDDTSFKVFGGYALNRNVALELAYFDGGTAEETFGPGKIEAEVSGINASVLGSLPLGEVFTLFGRIGFASYDVDVSARIGNNTVGSVSDSDEDLSYGVGGAFTIDRFELRAEYESIDASGGSFNNISVNGLYRF